LHLDFIPLEDGEESRMTVTAQQIEIRVVDLLGLGGIPARLIGGAGSLIGFILWLDKIFGWVSKLARRFRKDS
jgi:hypothetical protein